MSESSPLLRPQEHLESSSGTVTPSHSDAGALVSKADPEKPGPPKLIICGLFAVGYLYALDGSIVATLLTSIGSSFNESNMAAWLGTSYLLSAACFTPIYGRLSDIIGRRGAMMTALFFFGTGTLLCAVAPTMWALIVARAIAGIGGGGLTSTSTVIVSDLVSLKERGLYQGYMNVVFSLGSAMGGPVGGLFADYLGWRWAFVVQVPVLAATSALIYTQLHIPLKDPHQTISQRLKRIDFLGSATLGSSLGMMMMALTLKTATAEGMKWSDPRMIGLLAGSAVAMAAFLLVEWTVAPEPILPFKLLRQRNPALVAFCNWLLAALSFSQLYNVPLYFSSVMLVSSSEAGSHLIPMSVCVAIGSVSAGWYMRHTGKYFWILQVFCSFLVLSGLIMSSWSLQSGPVALWLAMAPAGLGSAGVMTITLIALIGSVERSEMATATGLSYTFRTTGQVMGVQMTAVLSQFVLQRKLEESITGKGAKEIIDQIRHSTDSIRLLPPDLRLKAQLAYQSALHVVFICQVVVGALIWLSMTMIKEVDLPASMAPAAPAPKRPDANEENGYGTTATEAST